MSIDLTSISDIDLIGLYPKYIEELKKRGIIRTNNIIGGLGDYIVVQTKKNISGLPKTQDAPTGTKNVDAISTN